MKKVEKDRKSEKNVSKGHKIQTRPQSGIKQSIWRGCKTGLYEMMTVVCQNLMKKDTFALQKMIRKPVDF